MAYQHNDKVIEAARALRWALIDDAPYGGEVMARAWAFENYRAVFHLALQKTEAEEAQ